MLNFYKFSYVFKKNDYTLLDLVTLFKFLMFLLFFHLICRFWDLYSFPEAATPNHHKVSGLKQQTVTLSQFWRTTVQNQSVRRSTLLPETPGEMPLLAPAGCPFARFETTSLQSLSPHHSLLCGCLPYFSFIRTLAMAFRTHLENPGWSHLQSPNLITSFSKQGNLSGPENQDRNTSLGPPLSPLQPGCVKVASILGLSISPYNSKKLCCKDFKDVAWGVHIFKAASP